MQDDLTQSLTDRYDRAAHVYGELWAPMLRTAGLVLLRELSPGRVGSVVDVGAGVGALLADLCETFPGAFVLGIDRSQGMLSLAPATNARAVMDARQLALPSASVDRVVLAFMLFHLDSPITALREARRVLRTGGQAGAITWRGALESAATRIWEECLDTRGAAPGDPGAEARHAAVDDPEKMQHLLRNAGFTPARCWVGELVARFDAEDLIRFKTSLGASKPRFDSLSPAAQGECIAEARRRMARLAPDDFVARAEIVYSVGDVA